MEAGLVSRPRGTRKRRVRPSRRRSGSSNPTRASRRETDIREIRSSPCRWKRACGRSRTTRRRSPVRSPGCSFPSPRSTICSPCATPGSIVTASVAVSSTILRPSQFAHTSAGASTRPSPEHSGQRILNCCTILPPSCRSRTTTPCPSQPAQTAPSLPPLPPVPLHEPHTRVRCSRSVFSRPEYISSRVRSSATAVSSASSGAPRPPPPPKNIENRSSALGPPAPPPPPEAARCTPALPC
mmetsp:Transcript_25708/g.65234  ORF Transcript_25708/g.65234 Transcript_25708/m.65234 type:complete len:240 (-) Transcript_25708:382-1101(-)